MHKKKNGENEKKSDEDKTIEAINYQKREEKTQSQSIFTFIFPLPYWAKVDLFSNLQSHQRWSLALYFLHCQRATRGIKSYLLSHILIGHDHCPLINSAYAISVLSFWNYKLISSLVQRHGKLLIMLLWKRKGVTLIWLWTKPIWLGK